MWNSLMAQLLPALCSSYCCNKAKGNPGTITTNLTENSAQHRKHPQPNLPKGWTETEQMKGVKQTLYVCLSVHEHPDLLPCILPPPEHPLTGTNPIFKDMSSTTRTIIVLQQQQRGGFWVSFFNAISCPDCRLIQEYTDSIPKKLSERLQIHLKWRHFSKSQYLGHFHIL